MQEFDSIAQLITDCFIRDTSREGNWYKGYKQTHNRVIASPTSDEVLELLWYKRDNSVASLMQGMPSKAEFENAKEQLKALTAKIIDSPDANTYQYALAEMQKFKDNGTFRFLYSSLLNRVFGAIVPDKVTSTTKDKMFIKVSRYINDKFALGLNFNGNWFENNVELKNAIRQHVSAEIDAFKVNIGIWNAYELLEEEKNKPNPVTPPRHAKLVNHFIFQGNPDKFNVDEYLANNTDIYWTASRFTGEMTVGDEAYIWRSGQKAGAVARGIISELPQTLAQLKSSEKLGKDLWADNIEDENTKKVGIRVEEHRLIEEDGMLTRNAIKQDGVMGNSSIIKSPQGTVFKLTNEEAEQLSLLWENGLNIDDNLIESELTKQQITPLNLTVEQYKEVLQADGTLGGKGLELLSAIYHQPNARATSAQLSIALGYSGGTPANALIGKLSKRIARYFGIEKKDIKNKYKGWWQLVATGERLKEGFTWQLKNNLKTALTDLGIINLGKQPDVREPEQYYMIDTPLNQIFYGPPGTGKTYKTIEAAVRAAEPDFVFTNRRELKAKYDELVSRKRIQFVTFHQSYGYEEFVEGLSAKTEGDQLSYFEKDGVFKTICEDAKAFRVASKGTEKNVFDERWQLFAESLADSESGIQVKTLSHKTFFTVTDVTNTTIRFDKSKGNSIHTLSLKTLKGIYNKEKEINGGLQPYYGALIEYLKQTKVPIVKHISERKNFVLIIDEINRGNISKIFGELITLIEPSKRLGQAEALEVTLPYSGDAFSIPDNLNIIGTMNTADRSLALMDTALRRRFDFVEMMPNYTVLSDKNGAPYCIEHQNASVNLPKLLATLNKRIAALYDREHTLGHAFLIPTVEKIKQCDHAAALTELASCFKNKIIPLLAEYFFEDWQKIRLVLADNQKEQRKLKPLVEKVGVEFEYLFGNTDDLELLDDELHDYQLIPFDSKVWDDVLTYVGMYDLSQLGS